MKNKKVFFIVDQSSIISIGLNEVLKNNFNFLMLNTTKHIEVDKLMKHVKVDLVFLEIVEKGELNYAIISEIKKNQPSAKILIFTEFNDKLILKQIKKNLNVHILEKNASKNEIIRKVSKILAIKKDTKLKRLDSFRLSDREKQISTMLLEGMKIIEISNHLNLSITTVSTYKNRVFKKLDIKNILELEKIYQQ